MALILLALLAQEFRTNLPEHDVRVKVLGFETAAVERPAGDPELVPGLLDCVVVGGGMSGLTAAFYLKDLKAVVLERDERAGGLAHRGLTDDGVAYGRGSAYYSEPPDLVMPLYLEMGLTPLEQTLIPSPIDSYWRKGSLLLDMWEKESFKALPAEFKAFHAKLLRSDKAGEIPVQPMDRADDRRLDRISAAEYIKDFGPELKAYLDAYCQSALGGFTEDISALAFTNFYSAEVVERYAWPGGTGGASVILAEKVKDLVRTGSAVVQVAQDADGVDVDYVRGGKLYRIRARQAILAVPLRVVDWIFPGLPEERRALIRSLKYADYVVHQVFTPKDLWTKTYDTWFVDKSFTDLIAARWIETKGFQTPAAAGPGILSIYQPLAPRRGLKALDARAVNDLAIGALRELYDVIPDLKKEKSLAMESYRWPASIHLCPPGFFSETAPKLSPPVGRVRFAGNNLGTPSFEEAIYRGHQAALHVREALGKTLVPRK
ncbi:MAG TPA: FAD-dependent oxidoreductase [Planctomycetota bacterium]